MKKSAIRWMLYIISLIAVFSCENTDQFLNKPSLSEITDTEVWSDLPLIETFVNSIYRNALGLPFAIKRLSDFSDESFFTPDWGTTNFNKGEISANDLCGWGDGWSSPQTELLRWAPLYSNVRRTNLFFSNIGALKTDEYNWVSRLKGEVYFLRAWTYASLVAMYGGVPIITKAYGINDDFYVTRNSYNDCIKFIASQLDSAALNLPVEYTDAKLAGRATKGAALALKSRVLLYAASDLHNPSKNGVVTNGYSKPELLGYTSGDAVARWQAAKDAAKAVIDLGKYDLYKKNPAPADSVAQNLVDFFLSKGTEEDILLQYFTSHTDEDWNGYNPGMYCGSWGYHNWANNTPIGDIVDEYEMKNGSKFDWNNPVHKSSPYTYREARFYATILYEGAPWRTRPADLITQDPFRKIQVGYISNLSGIGIKHGLDNPYSPMSNWSGSYSGYFLRKFIDPAVDPLISKQDIPFKHIRYAEILLNYAEVCIELGQDAEARTYINLIRKRAGQPDLATSLAGNALRQAYRHERRVEMVFEDQRFWDVRRWLIGPEAYHQTHKVYVNYVTATTSDDTDYTRFFIPPSGYKGKRSDNYRKPDGSTWSVPEFRSGDFPGDNRSWQNKYYFFPIMNNEMAANKNLIQNPGY
ncbi:MAG: RagB/SusD family nutrient uptake outer membrane protein [Bacteroidia bacterium]|nr:RagB/SusD family nutrient uptake outer membrane protein [Bacteroidia bacterium]